MKYSEEIFINKPLDEVILHFDDPEKLKEWMEGLETFEHLEGTPGEVGAKSRLVFKTESREIEMVETITVKDLPSKFGGTYEADGVFNTVINRFSKDGEDVTRMEVECEFEFTSFLMKMMGFFAPGVFRKHTRKNLDCFRKFAESQ